MGCSSSSPAIGRGDADHSAEHAATKNGTTTTEGPALTATRRSAGDWDVLARIDHASAAVAPSDAPTSNMNQPSSRPVASASAAVAVRGDDAWNSPCPLSVCGDGDDNATDSATVMDLAAPPGVMDLFPFLPDVTPPLAAVGAALPAVTHDRHDDRARPPEGLLGSPSVSAILLNDLQEGSQPSAAALSRSDVVLRRSPRSAPQPAARPSPFSSPIAAGTAPAQGSGGAVELPASVMSMRWAAGGGGSAAPPPRQARDPAKPPPRQPTAPRRRVPPKTP